MDARQTIRKRRRPASTAPESTSTRGVLPATVQGSDAQEACEHVGGTNQALPPTSSSLHHDVAANSSKRKRRYGAVDYAIISVTLAIALVTAAFFVYGFVLRASFHHGQECDMTYSRFKFLPIEVSNYTAGARPYRLLKFVDARDPRNVHLWRDDDIDTKESSPHDDGTKVHQLSDNWCLLPQSNYTAGNGISREAPYPNPGHPVLFIPGHWGEYKQARSLGAHGSTFTRRSHSYKYQNDVVRKLKDGTLNGKVSGGSDGDKEDIENFIYDVYTADFDGEGAGLHGSRLVRQAHFVAQSILTIAKACNAKSVTIVGHSIGGIVAKAVPLLSTEASQYIKTIITLATPHDGFPYAFDSTVSGFYNYIDEGISEKVKKGGEIPTVVSISGGLRDELIPPSSCSVDPSLGLTVLSTDVMPASTAEGSITDVSLGCDHKAISWCHNVLSLVRSIIFSAAANESLLGMVETRAARLRKHAKLDIDNYDYSEALRREVQSFSNSHGYIKAAALMTTMPYRAWEFVVLYFMAASVESLHAIISGRLEIIRTCKYAIFLPVPLAFVFTHISPLKWATFVTTTALSFGSCLLYAIILHGIFPLLSSLCDTFCRRKRRSKARRLEESWFSTAHIYMALISVPVAASIMYLYHFVQGHPTRVNGLAARAVVFWAMVLNTFAQMFWSSARDENRTSKLVAALFLPILPFAVAGKLAYALSLVSVGGQVDDQAETQFLRG